MTEAEWQKVLSDRQQVLIEGRWCSPVALLEGREGRLLVHVHVDSPRGIDGSQWRSYGVVGLLVENYAMPGTASEEARAWDWPVGSSPCPGQKVVWRPPAIEFETSGGFEFTCESRNLAHTVKVTHKFPADTPEVMAAVTEFIGWYATHVYDTLDPRRGFQGWDCIRYEFVEG